MIDIRDAFFDEIYNLAVKNKNLIFLTADMGAFSLERFKKDLPGQYINVGVAEQNLISIAAGLSLGGKKVFVYGIAAFVTQRCYEQIKIDLCCMQLPVTIIGIGMGIIYSSAGPTHHAIQDISVMRALPGMTIFNPSDPISYTAAARLSHENNGPVYVRMDRGSLPSLHSADENFADGLSLLKQGKDVLIVTTGIMTHKAFKVAKELAKHNIEAGIVDLYRIKPLNEDLLLSYLRTANRIVTLEEHLIIGGIGSLVSELLTDNGVFIPLKRIAIADKNIIACGDRDWLHSAYGIDIPGVITTVSAWLKS